jgi:hypothetical protein
MKNKNVPYHANFWQQAVSTTTTTTTMMMMIATPVRCAAPRRTIRSTVRVLCCESRRHRRLTIEKKKKKNGKLTVKRRNDNWSVTRVRLICRLNSKIETIPTNNASGGAEINRYRDECAWRSTAALDADSFKKKASHDKHEQTVPSNK